MVGYRINNIIGIKEGHDNNNERAVDMRVESEAKCMHK
jgi:hypothetical protein